MADDLAGRILGERFELLSQLGEGGYGSVYLAEQITMGRKVAIKVINPRVADTDDFIERFEREARVASRLQHPNTVIYFDFGQDHELHFLAMEFVDGRTLSDDINDKGPAGVARAAHMARQICGALSEAHKMGMVHRDLKPGNILLTERGGDPDFVKVIDFGLAKIVQGDSEISRRDLTGEGMLLGTPAYMAPEQIRGKPVDARCDIYALGVILFVMLTGEKPYDGDTPLGTAVMHLTEAIPLVRERNPGLPPEIENLVWRCMAKDPDARPTSVDELAGELELILQQVGPTVSGAMYLAQAPSLRALGDATPSGRTATLDPTPSTQSGQRLGRGLKLLGADPSSKTMHRPSGEEVAVPQDIAPAPSRALVMTLLAALVVAVGVTLALVVGPLGGSGEAADEVVAAADPQGDEESGVTDEVVSELDTGGSGSQHPLGTGGGVDHDPLALADPPADFGEAVRGTQAEIVEPAWLRANRAASQLAIRQSREAEEAEAEADRERNERRRRRDERDDDDEVAVEPEPSREGHLRITAVPWGRVFCNGASYGRTPIDEVVPVGTYDCRIVSPRGQQVRREVSVSMGGSDVVRVRFEP